MQHSFAHNAHIATPATSGSAAGSRFVTAKEAGSIVGYTADYVSRLARTGKVQAEQRNRVWYVSLDALKRFQLEQQAEQRARQEELRRSRLAEYAQKQVAADTSQTVVQVRRLAVPALLLTFIWVGVAVTIGGTLVAIQASGLRIADIAAGTGDVLGKVQQVIPAAVVEGVQQRLVHHPAASDTPVTARTVVVTEDGLVVSEGTAVADMFSDDVTVTTVTPDGRAVIAPTFTRAAEHATQHYQVTVLPVD